MSAQRMSKDQIRMLLGGYATGTLTPEEQQALFAAALDDQELFDALAREQSLRDLLREPAAKARVLMALDTAPARWYQKRPWLPAIAALAMVARFPCSDRPGSVLASSQNTSPSGVTRKSEREYPEQRKARCASSASCPIWASTTSGTSAGQR